MLAIDTNLIVRYLVGDDAGQAARARTIAVGTLIAERPPHRTVRARLRHTAPTSGV
jgi:hypothetical protein